MSDKRGHFDHYRQNGHWVQRKLTTRTVSDRLNPAVRTRYKGEGLCVGANVRFFGNQTGQVWSLAAAPYYWVVQPDGKAIRLQEVDLTVVGQAHDEPLFEVAS